MVTKMAFECNRCSVEAVVHFIDGSDFLNSTEMSICLHLFFLLNDRQV
jgi:hypothetical protein